MATVRYVGTDFETVQRAMAEKNGSSPPDMFEESEEGVGITPEEIDLRDFDYIHMTQEDEEGL